MPDNTPPGRLPAPAFDEPASATPSATSEELLRGQRELLIRHDKQVYRLRLTASNKLILMK